MFSARLRKVAGTTVTTVMWCAGFGVLVEDAVLLRQNQRLRAAMTQAPQLPVGKQLRDIAAVSLDGHLQQVELPTSDSQRLLIITFSPGCPACRDNMTGWAALTAQLKTRPDWRVLWVSRDPVQLTTERFTHEKTNDVLADPPYHTYLELGLGAVPNTIAVGAGGVVDRIWKGRLQPAEWDQIAAYFRVSTLVGPTTAQASAGGSPHK